MKTLLVFNCHEPWIYQLGVLGYTLDIIIGLKGKYNSGWDYHMRPLPAHARLITLPEALESPKSYYCIITHNTTDLLDVRHRSEPRLIVLHHTIEGRLREELISTREQVRQLSAKLEGTAGADMALAELKAKMGLAPAPSAQGALPAASDRVQVEEDVGVEEKVAVPVGGPSTGRDQK